MDPTLPFLAKVNNAASVVDVKETPEYKELKLNFRKYLLFVLDQVPSSREGVVPSYHAIVERSTDELQKLRGASVGHASRSVQVIDPKETSEYKELKRNHAELSRIAKECASDIKGLADSLLGQPYQPWKAQYVDHFRSISRKLKEAIK